MLTLPRSLKVSRSRADERALNDQMRAWVEGSERTPGLHASDILDPRLAYWRRKKPSALPTRLVWMFAVGRVLHELWLSAIKGRRVYESDAGSLVSEELGISFSPDDIEGNVVLERDGIPVELKTTRSFQAPRRMRDLRVYLEQVLIYMAALNKTFARLRVLYLNLKNATTRQTEPQVLAFEVRVTPEDLARVKAEVKQTAQAISAALAAGDHTPLPLCREWKCGRAKCEFFDLCKPEGRWTPKRGTRS